MKHELIFSGIGGQGILLSGQILCSAAVKQGHLVTWAPVYGQEKRGGRTMCQIVISDEIGSPVVSEAEIVMVMDEASLKDYEQQVTPGGYLILNSSMITKETCRDDVNVIKVPFNDIAKEVGNPKTLNMVALGSVLRYFDLISLELIKQQVAEAFAAKPNIIEINQKALQAGYDFIKLKSV
jgi:2-oxoglutarate ferredoxin oxidoreductase subunit gamma